MISEPGFSVPPPYVPGPKVSAQPGIALTLLLHGLAASVLAVLDQAIKTKILQIWLLAIGMAQLPYMIPAIMIAKRTRKPGVMKGLFIGASLTLLLNGLCWGGGLIMIAGMNFR